MKAILNRFLTIVLPNLIYLAIIIGVVPWYWENSDESQRSMLFYFIFVFTCCLNAYYSIRISNLKQLLAKYRSQKIKSNSNTN